jgi:lipopolysaccharide transport system ATP-binding protein
VLAVGDSQFQKKCIGKMEDVSAKEGRTVLFVSHNMSTIKKLCNTGVLLEKGLLKTQDHIQNVMITYEKSIFDSNKKLQAGMIYENFLVHSDADFWINKIEMFDEEEKPKFLLATWDYVKFRIHYVAKKTIHQGSGLLSVTTFDNTNLLLCSTMPDRSVTMKICEGQHYFDCTFKQWPLAAGQYLLQAGLAIPMKEWLCQTNEPIPLTIHSKDIFNSGMPPESSRYLIAAPYEITPEVIVNG